MPKKIQFKDVYDDVYELYKEGDSKFPVKPELYSRGNYKPSKGMLMAGGLADAEEWRNTAAHFSVGDHPNKALGRSGGLFPSSITYNPDNLNARRPGGMSEYLKNMRYVAAHELGHAKDFDNMVEKLTTKQYIDWEKAIKIRSEAMRQIETRGAQIHMPFLAREFGRDALPYHTKKGLIWKEVMGNLLKEGETTVPTWKVLAEANRLRIPNQPNTQLPQATMEILKKNLKGVQKSSSGFVYKDLAKIARKHGLMGLLMATMLTAGAGAMGADE